MASNIFTMADQRGANASNAEENLSRAFLRGIGEGFDTRNNGKRNAQRSDADASLYTMQAQLGGNLSKAELRVDNAFLRGIKAVPISGITNKPFPTINGMSGEKAVDEIYTNYEQQIDDPESLLPVSTINMKTVTPVNMVKNESFSLTRNKNMKIVMIVLLLIFILIVCMACTFTHYDNLGELLSIGNTPAQHSTLEISAPIGV